MIPVLATHLWQSTLFAGLAALFALALRNNRAQTRYWIWMTASAKFFLPFSPLVAVGGCLSWRPTPQVTLADLMPAIDNRLGPTVVVVNASLSARPGPDVMQIAGFVWICGILCVLGHWILRWIRMAAVLRSSSAVQLEFPVPVRTSASLIEPGVFGILHPVLLLPEGVAGRLAPDQFQAILAHESSHIRRRDNLTAVLHMLVEAVFWFHPLVWWIGARLVDEREGACDEEVLRRGVEPQVYAAGILAICKFYVESPLACAPGATGANLRRRIEAILGGRPALHLTFAKKAALAAAASFSLIAPLIVGVWNAPPVRAQSRQAPSASSSDRFAVASVKPTTSGDVPLQLSAPSRASRFGHTARTVHGSVRLSFPLKELIMVAYDVKDIQVLGGPAWTGSDFYEVIAKAENLNANIDQLRVMLRFLLADRFQLTLRHETREMPIYELYLAKSGLKLEPSKPESCDPFDPNAPLPRLDPQHPPSRPNICGGTWDSVASGLPDYRLRFEGLGVTMPILIIRLSQETGRIVVDKTGFTDRFDFRLEFAPDLPAPSGAAASPALPGPSVIAALQQQLGLRLESAKGPVEVLTIDHVERPSAN